LRSCKCDLEKVVQKGHVAGTYLCPIFTTPRPAEKPVPFEKYFTTSVDASIDISGGCCEIDDALNMADVAEVERGREKVGNL
jgi:hypothetical protein